MMMNSFQKFYYSFIVDNHVKYRIINFKIRELKYKKIKYIILDDLLTFVFMLNDVIEYSKDDLDMKNIHYHILYFLKNYILKYVKNDKINIHTPPVININNDGHDVLEHELIYYKIIKYNNKYGICINNNLDLKYYLDEMPYNTNIKTDLLIKIDNYHAFNNIIKNVPIHTINKSPFFIFSLFKKKDKLKENARYFRKSRNTQLTNVVFLSNRTASIISVTALPARNSFEF